MSVSTVSPNPLSNDTRPPKKWYQEPWCWFILTPLIVVVIVSSITVTIAVKGADDRVVDNYYKEGRMINMRMDAERQAQLLGVSADVTFDVGIGEVLVKLQQASGDLPDQLLMELVHPAQKEKDQQLLLKATANGFYVGQIQSPETLLSRHYVRIISQANTGDEPWRINGQAFLTLDNADEPYQLNIEPSL